MPDITITKVPSGGGHRYKVEGDERVDPTHALPTISTIARHADSGGGDGLLYWAVDAYIQTGIRSAFDAKRDAAASIGTDLHSSIEEYIATGNQPSNPSPLFGSWYSSLHEAGVVWYASEVMVYSPTGFAGTVDAIGYLDGVPTLFDWKTTDELDKYGKRKRINNSTHAAQIGGYLWAIDMMADQFPELPQPVQAYLIYVFKDTLEVLWKAVNVKKSMEAFQAAHTLYALTHGKGGLYVQS
jgi:hypothetical protein